MVILTKQERDKFAFYLEQQADTNKELATQMEKLPSTFSSSAMAKTLKQDAVAFAYVATRIRAVEDQTIEP